MGSNDFINCTLVIRGDYLSRYVVITSFFFALLPFFTKLSNSHSSVRIRPLFE